MLYPKDLKYSDEHEWVRLEDGKVRVGITDYAQDQLGDVVYIEFPQVGTEVQQGKSFIVVESVKTVSDVYAPASGTVVEINEALEDAPELINESPYEQGWMAIIAPQDVSELDALMDADAYEAFVASLE
ncbi:MAG: glycine cleavage system protein GcvH [Candidatus Bipolaricaulia bacterium]